MTALIPPGVLDSLPPIITAIIVLLAGLSYVLREWRKGLADRADEAEAKLKATKEEADSRISELETQVRQMRKDFDRQFADLRMKLNEQIDALQSDNLHLNGVVYQLRSRLADHGITHNDIE